MLEFERSFIRFLEEDLGLCAESPKARVAEAAVLEARSKLKHALTNVEKSTSVEGMHQAAIEVSLAATTLNDKKLRLLGLLLKESSSRGSVDIG